MESGVRFHSTKFARDKSDMPSPFAMKLRKFIRTKRLEDVRQLGTDRVVDFKFGSGEAVYHIIMELYASGNIILTDGNYEVLALLRSHQFEEDVIVQVNHIYPIAYTTTIEASADHDADANNLNPILAKDIGGFMSWLTEKETDLMKDTDTASLSKSEKKNKAKKAVLKQVLIFKDSGISSYGPEIIEHCILSSGYKTSTKISEVIEQYNAKQHDNIANLLHTLTSEATAIVHSLHTPGQQGYIILKERSATATPSPTPAAAGADGDSAEIGKDERRDFAEFTPYLFKQYEGKDNLSFASFDEAVDEFFCKV